MGCLTGPLFDSMWQHLRQDKDRQPMSDLRALLVTDVVDSTAIGSRIGDAAMSLLWQSHDRQARDLLDTWRGREIDRSDGFLLLFDAAADALGYALDYHRMLRTLKPARELVLVARAGIHVGPLTLRSNPAGDVARGAKRLEIDGLAKAVAARVMSVARGGQTLLTAAAHERLGAIALPTRSHGWWRLKGLPEPLELFEAGEAGTLFEPPADGEKVHRVVLSGDHWLPAREIGHSLPAEPDAFIGRANVLRALSGLVDGGARLICIHGMGGSGKTRLALHYGWRWLGDFADGVWFCDLSAARDLEGVVRAVSQGLQVPLGRADAVTQLGQAIAGRGPCLVILDNFEQVASLAPATLGVWLARAGQARFLVTSREVLHLAGEEVLELGPMNRTEGIALFARRAAAAGAPPPRNDDADLATLVDLLDGLPLAIELAAARCALMPPHELLKRMGERFKLLAGARGRPDHQATLRATLDWSWQMLSPAERDALAQLSVFDSGASLAAIEATVERGTRDEAPPLVDVLQSLVEKSLVRRVGEHRLDLLSTVREYAAECLATAGCFPGSGAQAMAQARSRHWQWFAAQAPEDAVRDGCADLGNWVAATRHAVAAGAASAACAALEGSWEGLRLRGPFGLGIELASQVAQLPLDALERSRVDRIAGWAMRVSGRVAEARQRFDAALNAALALPDGVQEARVRSQLALLYLNLGRFEPARGELLRALAIAQRSGDRLLECEVLSSLGDLAIQLGQPDTAAEHFTRVLELARRAGYRRWEGGALGNLGLVRDQQGRSDEARRLYESALVVARELGDRQWEGNNLCNLGLLLHLQGDLAGAQQALEAALATARALGHARLECIASINSALVAGALGDNAAAEVLFAQALQLTIELEDRRSQAQVRGGLGALYARAGRFDEARGSLKLGAALLEQAADPLSLGLLLCDRAEFEHLAGHTEAARATVAQARSLGIETGSGSELGHRLLAVERLLGP
jgi:predicted ATPase/class 3 adenylate cyclase/Flp pilus assembly protein TadD